MDHHHNCVPPPPSAAAGSWAFSWEQQELREALIGATLELETTRAAAQEELGRMEGQTLRLARLLEAVTRERDEARIHCHSLLLLLMDHQRHPTTIPIPGTNCPTIQAFVVDEGSNVVMPASSSSSDENDSNVSPALAAERRVLPEKGRLVEAVMGAGPLLQTLLLAGPLPQWRHPPPAMQNFEIPPVSIPHRRVTEEPGFGGLSPSPTFSPPTLLTPPSCSPDSNSSALYDTINITPFHI